MSFAALCSQTSNKGTSNAETLLKILTASSSGGNVGDEHTSLAELFSWGTSALSWVEAFLFE